MPTTTRKDLSEKLDIQEISEKTRTDFESRHRRRRSINDWTIALMPAFVLLAALTFYLLSAPHTVGLLDRITPGWGFVSPVGIELFIVAISAVHQHGWVTKETRAMMFGLMLTAIIVNVFGGMLSVLDQAGDQFKGLTFIEIIQNFWMLEAKWQIIFVLTPIIGILIPIAGKFAGSFVMKMAKGEIKFQSVTIEDMWLKERGVELKAAFMNAALKAGAGPRTAGEWSQKVIEEIFEIEQTPAVGQALDTSFASGAPMMSKREMGFATSHQVQMDAQERGDDEEIPGQKFSIRGESVVKWIEENDERVRRMLSSPENRRVIAKKISMEIIGQESGYKTIERILQKKGYYNAKL